MQVRTRGVRGLGREQRQGGTLLRQDGGKEEGFEDDQRPGRRQHVMESHRKPAARQGLDKDLQERSDFGTLYRVRESMYFSIMSCISIPTENGRHCTGYNSTICTRVQQ